MAVLARAALAANMTVSRLVLAVGLCVALAGSQLWQSAFERDDWPLSSYPMYSHLQPRVVGDYSLVGVTAGAEVPLGPQYTRPLVGARLRAVLRADISSADEALVPTLCGNLRKAKRDDIASLRVYKRIWAINPELVGLHSPPFLAAATPLICRETKARLLAERRGTSEPDPAMPAPADALVFELEEGMSDGPVTIVDDRYAHGGKALRIDAAQARLSFSFKVPAGTYALWLRGKLSTDAKPENAGVEFTDGSLSDTDAPLEPPPAFNAGFPAGVYVWSSNGPAAPPIKRQFSNSAEQQLVIVVKGGPLILDQLVLTQRWPERPLSGAPVSR
ncbi:MAG TPA: hypothetical protein VHM70_06260 [Polyangiaceae bacterium]|nr:hypothetical protein [Polyangiaceae bacterium]